jgi:DNA-binding protein HU-beta
MTTKAELIRKIADRANTQQAIAEELFNATVGVITEELQAGEEIPFPGLGKLIRTVRAARTGRNPQTGEQIQIPQRYALAFKASSKIKELLN